MSQKWNVIGFFEDTAHIVSFEVEATSSLSAFAVAARENDAVTFVAAVPCGVEVEFPGESLVDAQTIIEQDDVFILQADEGEGNEAPQAPKHVCPNCGLSAEHHPENGCVLAALVVVASERGELSQEQLLQLHTGADVDALWNDLGPIVDKLSQGAYNA